MEFLWGSRVARVVRALAYLSLLFGFLTLLHQYVFWQVWFELDDIHHETFAVALFSFGLGILIGWAGGGRQARAEPS